MSGWPILIGFIVGFLESFYLDEAIKFLFGRTRRYEMAGTSLVLIISFVTLIVAAHLFFAGTDFLLFVISFGFGFACGLLMSLPFFIRPTRR
jgi:hypothetical protein